MYFAKENSVSYDVKKEYNMFYHIHKRNVNIVYVHSMEHRAVRLLSKRYDLTATGYKFLELESTLVHQVTWRLP